MLMRIFPYLEECGILFPLFGRIRYSMYNLLWIRKFTRKRCSLKGKFCYFLHVWLNFCLVWKENFVIFVLWKYSSFLISGLGLILPVSLYKTLSSCQNSNSGLSDSLKNIRITGLLTARGLKFLYPHGTTVPLQATVKCKSGDSESVSIPNPLREIEWATGLKLEEIAYDTGMQCYLP